ncbi:hypothetical protein Naga_100601g2 [Nannochloropsis gaditana]|uniref:Uncharacterized protein n=1 Tax=Nannochloropsis gaditana TaxID=72520 RepID=W7U991_9STRA|nr:hypothetical protein Naga_100601g2 [Nannochloropsis gaditana]
MSDSFGTCTRQSSTRKPPPAMSRKGEVSHYNRQRRRLRWLVSGSLVTLLLTLNIISLRGRRSDVMASIETASNNEHLALPSSAVSDSKILSDDLPQERDMLIRGVSIEKSTTPESRPSPESSFGSQEDLELALRITKEKILHEKVERQKQPKRNEQNEENDPANSIQTANSKEKASLLGPFEAEGGNPAIPLLQPAGEKATRPPISGRPPLHRPASETHVQKIILTISSIDRGERISDLWAGDKLLTILKTLVSVRELCERGFDLTVWFIAAWKISQQRELIEEALFCQRTQEPVQIRYWDHFPPDVGGFLSSRHRLAMAKVMDEYDFFISIEDDIYLTPSMVDAYVHASGRLALTTDAYAREHHMVGFSRKEHDLLREDRAWALWETLAVDYHVLQLPGAGWWAQVTGNPHQAMWMATREQIYNFESRCESGFLKLKHPREAEWVEFHSGALQVRHMSGAWRMF